MANGTIDDEAPAVAEPVPPGPFVSPKVSWPTAALIGLGAVLLVLDKLGVIDVDDSIWLTLLGGGVGAGGIGFAKADPADTRKGSWRPK